MAVAAFWGRGEPGNLVITVALWSWATAMVWRGALLGASAHARPRLMLATTMTVMVVVYLAELFDIVSASTRADLTRSCGWVLAIAVGWTAVTGVRYGRKVERVVKQIDNSTSGDSGSGSG